MREFERKREWREGRVLKLEFREKKELRGGGGVSKGMRAGTGKGGKRDQWEEHTERERNINYLLDHHRRLHRHQCFNRRYVVMRE